MEGGASFIVTPEPPKEGEALPAVENNPDVEKQWAIKAFKQAEIYLKLINTVKETSKLKLTKIDDEIYNKFRSQFPSLNVAQINEDELKSNEPKEIWRPFMMSFQDIIEDFNFLTLLRVNCKKEYTEENTIVVPRIQFYCIEITRLREGHNNNN